MPNSNNSSENIGCLVIIGLIILIPMLIDFIKVLMPLAMIGGAIYAFFHLKNYDAKTGNITKAFEKTFKINEQSNNTLELPQHQDGHYGLPAGTNDEIISKLSDIDSKITIIKAENEEIKGTRKRDIQDALEIYAEEIKTENKKDLLNQIYGSSDDASGYQSSDEYEKKEFLEKYRKKKEELDVREIKQDLAEKLFDQDQKIFEFRDEAKEDRYKIRQEMSDLSSFVKEKLFLLEKEVISGLAPY